MMLRQIALITALVGVLAGCSHTISGTYVAHDTTGVEMLQLTQSPSGSILGTLNEMDVKPDGTISNEAANITGISDGSSVTISVKFPVPLIPALNMSGTVSGNVITLTTPSGTSARFVGSSARNYQAAVQQLTTKAKAIQQQRKDLAQAEAQQQHLADLDGQVAALNKRLTDYAAMVQSPRNQQARADWHHAHEQILSHARHDLEIEQIKPRGSYQADQIDFVINQLQFKLNGIDFNWLNVPSTGRDHLRAFDVEIARSPCAAQSSLPHCAAQPAAVRAYEAAKTVVVRRMVDIETTMRKDDAAMKSLVSQAQQYTHN